MYKNLKIGYFKPSHPEKYKGNANNIVYRSGLELKYFKYMDFNKYILEWNSEEISIPYKNIDGKIHRYYIDLWFKLKNKDGIIKECICEIKPKSFISPPPIEKRHTKLWNEKLKSFCRNTAKWNYAKDYATKKGMEFLLLTEKEIHKY